MDSNIKLTTKQAEEKMKIYREVFDVVRIIKSTDIRRMQCGQEPELDENMCRCYDFWNKDKQCENCVSEKALTQKKQCLSLIHIYRESSEIFNDILMNRLDKVEIKNKNKTFEVISKNMQTITYKNLIDSTYCLLYTSRCV